MYEISTEYVFKINIKGNLGLKVNIPNEKHWPMYNILKKYYEKNAVQVQFENVKNPFLRGFIAPVSMKIRGKSFILFIQSYKFLLLEKERKHHTTIYIYHIFCEHSQYLKISKNGSQFGKIFNNKIFKIISSFNRWWKKLSHAISYIFIIGRLRKETRQIFKCWSVPGMIIPTC